MSPAGSPGLRALAWPMTALFVVCAGVQWNDPDPVRWITFYLLAAAASLGTALGRAWRGVEIAAVGISAVVVLVLAAPALGPGSSPRAEALASFRMERPEDELLRELGGAAIALTWSTVLVARRHRTRPVPRR